MNEGSNYHGWKMTEGETGEIDISIIRISEVQKTD